MTASKTLLSAAAIAVIGAFGVAQAQTSPAASAADPATRTSPAAAEQRATATTPATGTAKTDRMAKEKKPMKAGKEATTAAPATQQADRTTPPTPEQSGMMQKSGSSGMQNMPSSTSPSAGARAQMPAASGASRGDKPGAPTSARP